MAYFKGKNEIKPLKINVERDMELPIALFKLTSAYSLCYSEVSKWGCGIIDLVLLNPKNLYTHAIELKMRDFAVVERQAFGNYLSCNYSSICMPDKLFNRHSKQKKEFLKTTSFGVYVVKEGEYKNPANAVECLKAPKLKRHHDPFKTLESWIKLKRPLYERSGDIYIKYEKTYPIHEKLKYSDLFI